MPYFGASIGDALSWAGIWESDRAYRRYDVVEFEGSAYVAVASHSDVDGSHSPLASDVWERVAQGVSPVPRWALVGANKIEVDHYNNQPAYPAHSAGDLLFLAFFGGGDTGFQDTAGFTVAGEWDCQGGKITLAYKIAGESEAGVRLAAASKPIVGVFGAYRNLAGGILSVDLAQSDGSDSETTGGLASEDALEILAEVAVGTAAPTWRLPSHNAAVRSTLGTRSVVLASRELSGAYGAASTSPVGATSTHLVRLLVNATAVAPPTACSTQQSDYTLVLGDASTVVVTDSDSENEVTIPTHADVAFPVGTELDVVQYGAGATTIIGADGVTVSAVDDALTLSQYGRARLLQYAADEWLVFITTNPPAG